MAAAVEGSARRLRREDAEESVTRAYVPSGSGAPVSAGVAVGRAVAVGAGEALAVAVGRATMPSSRRK